MAPDTLSATPATPHPLWRPGDNPAVDLVMFRERFPGAPIEILMVRRIEDAPACGGMLANPGGFVDSLSGRGEPFVPAETPRQAALRELAEETGLSRDDLDSLIKEIGRYDSPARDPRSTPESYVSSTAFSVFLRGEWGSKTEAGTDASAAPWMTLMELGDEVLAFDHGTIIQDAARAMGIELPVIPRSWADSPAPSAPKPAVR